jgi:hypothetical protein
MAKKYQRPSTIAMAGLTQADYIHAITTLDTPLAVVLASRDPRSDFFKLMMHVAAEKNREQIWIHELHQKWIEQVRRESLQEVAARLKSEMMQERELIKVARHNEAILAKASAPTSKNVTVPTSKEAFEKLLEKLTQQITALQEQKSDLIVKRESLTKHLAEVGQTILADSQTLHGQQATRAAKMVEQFKTHLPVNAIGETVTITPTLEQKLLKAMTPTPLHHVLHYNPGLRDHLHELAASPSETMSAGKAKCVMDCVASQINVAGALADDENISVKAIFALIKRNQAQMKAIKPVSEDIALCNQIIHQDIQKETIQDELHQVKSQIIQVDKAIHQTQRQFVQLEKQQDLVVDSSHTPRSSNKPG